MTRTLSQSPGRSPRRSPGQSLGLSLGLVVRNVVFTVVTATLGTIHDRAINMGLLTTSTLIFGGCLFWISRMPVAAPAPKA